MRMVCNHGYFKFIENVPGEIATFMNTTGIELSILDDYFTFPILLDAPNYSIKGAPYLGVTAKKNFEGEPWEVMRANDLIYDFSQDKVVFIDSISQALSIVTCATYFRASGMIIPGSVMDDGTRVTDYAAFIDYPNFYYSEIDSE